MASAFRLASRAKRALRSADAHSSRGSRAIRRPARGSGARAGGPEGRRGARPARRVRGLPHRPVHRVRRRPLGLRADRPRARRGRHRRTGRQRGLVGLGAVAGCRLQGAERIVALDLSPQRLELARGQGATDVLAGGPDAVQQVLDLTDGFGADFTFEATGNVGVMRQAVESARMGWGLATMCGVAGKGETLDVVPRYLITGRRVAGSSFGGVKGRDQVPQLVDRWLAGELDIEPLISHRLALDEVNRAFELMEAQDGIRSVIVFDS